MGVQIDAVRIELDTPQNSFVPLEKIRVSYELTNLGALAQSGRATLSLYLSEDDVFSPETDLPLLRRSLSLNLKSAGSGRNTVRSSVTLPLVPGVGAGNYRLFAVLSVPGVGAGAAGVAELTVANVFGNLERGGRNRRITLTLSNPDGSATRISLSGPGRGEVIVNSDGSRSIVLHGTTTRTSVTITGTKKSIPEFASIRTAAGEALGSLNAAGTNITGDLLFGGGLKSLKIGDVGTAGVQHRIWIGGAGRTTISGGFFRDLTLEAAGRALSGLKVRGWSDRADTVADAVSAASLGVLRSANGFEADVFADNVGTVSILGDADLTLSSVSLSKFTVRGDFTGILAAGVLRSVRIYGDAADALFLGGNTLGGDHRIGGGNDALEGRSPSKLGLTSLTIGGNVENVLIASGIDPVDGRLLNGDDILAGVGDSRAYRIGKVTIGGELSDTVGILAANVPASISAAGHKLKTSELPNYTRTVPTAGSFILSADPGVLIAGVAERTVFTADAGPGRTVYLYRLDSPEWSGASPQVLCRLYDNGSALYGDAVAGDGVYSNILALETDSPGTLYYGARSDVQNSEVLTVAAVAEPDRAEVEDSMSRMSAAGTVFAAAEAAGRSKAESFAAVIDFLSTDASIAADSILVSDNLVLWTTAGGMPGSFCYFDEELRGGTGDASDGEPEYAASIRVDAPAATDITGEAIVIAPYKWTFELHGGDESNEIAETLADAGMEVVTYYGGLFTDGGITLETYKNLGQYEAVVISTHGLRINDPQYGENQRLLGGGKWPGVLYNSTVYIDSGVAVTTDTYIQYMNDIVAGRLLPTNKNFLIAPSFFTAYSGTFNDSIVYVSSCHSLDGNTMAQAFLSSGAAAYIGYTDTVRSGFASVCGEAAFVHLVGTDAAGNLNQVGSLPGLHTDDGDSTPAEFTYAGRSDATLPEGLLLNNYELYIAYSWGEDVRDLDTGTRFLGDTVGWRWSSGGEYLSWSGDDTSAKGREVVVVDLNRSFDDGLWNGSVEIDLMAGWYAPAHGSGPAMVKVGLRRIGDATDSNLECVVTRTINPGTQSSAASTEVGTLRITSQREGDDAVVGMSWIAAV